MSIILPRQKRFLFLLVILSITTSTLAVAAQDAVPNLVAGSLPSSQRRNAEALLPPSPLITPPPALYNRQDDGQIRALSDQLQRLSSSSQSLSQASQQLSQSSQQLSQSLQQATQRLSQTESSLASARASQNAAEQASRSLSQQVAELSRRASETDRQMSESMRAVSRTMEQSMASVTRSMGQSFSLALAAATRSAASVMQSAQTVVQKAQEEKDEQIQMARGEAVGVTQTALAVVGGIIGGSLVTVGVVVLVLRLRKNKRTKTLGQKWSGEGGSKWGGVGGNSKGGGGITIGEPKLEHTSNKAYSFAVEKKGSKRDSEASSIYSFDAKALEAGMIQAGPTAKLPPRTTPPEIPMAAAVNAPDLRLLNITRSDTTKSISRKSVGGGGGGGGGGGIGITATITAGATKGHAPTKSVVRGGVGFVTSYYGGPPPPQQPQAAITTSTSSIPSTTIPNGGGGDDNIASNTIIVPKKIRLNTNVVQLSQPPPPRRGGGKFTLFPKNRDEFNSPTSMSTASPVSANGSAKTGIPSLDTWLRNGTVSPFATLNKKGSPTQAQGGVGTGLAK